MKTKIKIPFEWESLDDQTGPNSFDITHRAKVYGGWIVINETYFDCKNGRFLKNSNMIFIQDYNRQLLPPKGGSLQELLC